MSGYEPKSKLGATQEKGFKMGQMLKKPKKLNHQEQFQISKKSKYCRNTRIG